MLFETAAKLVGPVAQPFFLNHIEYRIGCGNAQGAAAVGAAQAAGRRRIHDFGPPRHGGQRKATGQRFGHCCQVR